MKPAPFVHHVPKTLDEALKTLAEVAPKDGRVLAGGQSLVPIMAFRLAKPAHLVDINGVAGLDKLASDGKTLSIGACVRHAAFHKPVIANPLGTIAHCRCASYRALSDPHAWDFLRKSRTRRSLVGMVPGRSDARRHARREKRARHSRHRGERFFRRHHVHDPGGRRIARRGETAPAFKRHQVWLQRIQSSRRRFRHGGIARDLPTARRQDPRCAHRCRGR